VGREFAGVSDGCYGPGHGWVYGLGEEDTGSVEVCGGEVRLGSRGGGPEAGKGW